MGIYRDVEDAISPRIKTKSPKSQFYNIDPSTGVSQDRAVVSSPDVVIDN